MAYIDTLPWENAVSGIKITLTDTPEICKELW